jgi:hypothetical protein
LAFGILLASAAWLSAEDKIGDALNLDHFHFYKVEPQPTKQDVSLHGQFDKEASVPAHLPTITYFANPVSKDGDKIHNRLAHLTWYTLEQRLQEPKRVVDFENQFGKQEIVIGQPVALLVPTEKIEQGSKPPEKVDHYKVYEVLKSKQIERKVTLKDQFGGEEGVPIGKTMFFAVPVTKKHGETVTKIVNPKGHLTIYAIRPKPLKKPQETIDQFGKHKLTILESDMLALPTIKLGFKVTD